MRGRFLAAVLAAAILGGGSYSATTDQAPPAPLDRLKAGNLRFVRDPGADLPNDHEKRKALVKGQTPFAMVLSCADARVPPEVIFNAGLGDLYVIRTAGHAIDATVLASLEYGATNLKARLLVVLGHDMCDVVRTAIENRTATPPDPKAVDVLTAAIKPSFDRLPPPIDTDHLREAVLVNVEQTVNDIVTKSGTIRKLAASGDLQVVGGFYELATGRVRFSNPVDPTMLTDAREQVAKEPEKKISQRAPSTQGR